MREKPVSVGAAPSGCKRSSDCLARHDPPAEVLTPRPLKANPTKGQAWVALAAPRAATWQLITPENRIAIVIVHTTKRIAITFCRGRAAAATGANSGSSSKRRSLSAPSSLCCSRESCLLSIARHVDPPGVDCGKQPHDSQPGNDQSPGIVTRTRVPGERRSRSVPLWFQPAGNPRRRSANSAAARPAS